MNPLLSSLWSESLKAVRSKVSLFTAIGFSLLPLVGGFFMIILKDPAAARSMGLISTKAQLTAGTADWPAYFGLLAQGTAAGGMFLFAIVTAWVFGREFSDHTVKELLALPTPRSATVAAKFVMIAVWSVALTLLIFLLALLVGRLVVIPGYSTGLVTTSFVTIFGTALLTIALMPFVALVASAGHGYLPAFGWMLLTVVLAQVAAYTGWGDWFPWAVGGLFSGTAGPHADLLGPHSFAVVAIAMLLGLWLTFAWWRDADQTR